jgi:hypothetical protein
MGSSRAPAVIAGVALVAAVVAFFVLRDSDDDATEAPAVTQTTETTATTTTREDKPEDEPEQPKPEEEPEAARIVIEGGEPAGGVAELTFAEGEAIRFEVASDVAEEVHMHGYDVSKEVEAGGSVEFDVPATITGVFEVELEHSVVPIAEITVNPA